MMGIGLVYFVYLLAARRSFAMPGKAIEPEDVRNHGALTTTVFAQCRRCRTGQQARRGGPQTPAPRTAAAPHSLIAHARSIVRRWSACQQSTFWPTTPAPAATRRC